MANKWIMILVGMTASLAGFGIGWFAGREMLVDELFKNSTEVDDFEEEPVETEYPVDNENRAIRLEEARAELKARASQYDGKKLYHKYIIKEGEEEPAKNTDFKPVIIDVETYEDEMEQDNWDKIEYTFFANRTENCPNGILIDEYAGLKVVDPVYDIGQEALDILRAVPEGTEANVYVRNPILACDILVRVSWDPLTDEELEAYEDIGDLAEEGGVKG